MPDEIALKLILDFKGGVEFTPVKGEGFGPWECWRNCEGGNLPDGTAGLIPTGDWLCWNSDEPEQKCGFAAMHMAETFCVFHNGPGSRTRIMDPFVGDRASDIRYESIAPAIKAEMEKLA